MVIRTNYFTLSFNIIYCACINTSHAFFSHYKLGVSNIFSLNIYYSSEQCISIGFTFLWRCPKQQSLNYWCVDFTISIILFLQQHPPPLLFSIKHIKCVWVSVWLLKFENIYRGWGQSCFFSVVAVFLI